MISKDMLEETLRDKGYRFMISPDKVRGRWCNPIEIPHFYADWFDCTDMPNDEYLEFLEKDLEKCVDVTVQ